MSNITAPKVDCEQIHPGLAVSDILAAVEFYTKKLGFWLAFTWGEPPTMAGVNLGHVQLFLEKGTPSPRGCSVYFVVGDADELYEFQRDNGVEIVEPPADREYGLRDYMVRDLHGYHLAFGHRLNVATPPLKIERVEVLVRLEKRLAALLHDLAEYQHLSLGSCLEKILLHTWEPFSIAEGREALERGKGVPSPHTRKTLEYIQELKKKHGIDYDSHASYRFVEDE